MPFFLFFFYVLLNVHNNPAIHHLATTVKEARAWTPLFREHGRLILSTLSHFLALLPFSISAEYFNCWSEKKQANIYRHFILIKSSKYFVQQSRGSKYATTNKHKIAPNNMYPRSGNNNY